ncbi:MAG: hypothetical protein QM704_20875 [Anaeromyxobacteraceae bacterium]
MGLDSGGSRWASRPRTPSSASSRRRRFFALLSKGPVLEKHRTDVETTGLYWYVVVAWWVPTYALLYLDPLLLARGAAP